MKCLGLLRLCNKMAAESFYAFSGCFIFSYKLQVRDFRRFLRRYRRAKNPYLRRYRNNGHRRIHIQVDCQDMLHYHQEILQFVRLEVGIQG